MMKHTKILKNYYVDVEYSADVAMILVMRLIRMAKDVSIAACVENVTMGGSHLRRSRL